MKRTAPLLVLFACATAFAESVSLDGAWQIAFDHRNEGRAGRWYKQQTFESLSDRRTIQIPSCWETIEQDYEGAAWYGLRFRVPAAWRDKLIRLQFSAVNYRAEVWINDQPAGFHEGGYTPFELTIGDLLRPGEENFLAVRVLGPVLTKNTVLDGIGPNETPHWRGAITGGIWQSVQLVASNNIYVSRMFVQPEIRDSRARVRTEVENASGRTRQAVLEVVLDGNAGSARREVALRPGHNRIDAEISIPNAKLWSPEHPNLYTVHATLSAEGNPLDRAQQRFGMREFVIRGQNYYLNGRKILIKAGFWEGLYPQTLAFPPNANMVRREIRLAKEAGFNVLRPWRKPPAPMILDLADAMGIMLVGAPPIECMDYWPQLAPETENRIATEVREMILRDRNHPSVIYWELFNEIVRHGLARLKQRMSLLARDLDPTRIVIDESGGWAEGAHAYPPYSYEPVAINEVHSYKPAPVSPQTYDLYLHLPQGGSDPRMLGRSAMKAPDGLIFVSEVGYGAFPDLPANVARYKREGNPLTPDYRYHVLLLEGIERAAREMRWGEIFPDTAALCRASQRVQAEANRLQLEALRLNPRIAGYCLHAYTDGDWVVGAGVLDLFRNPKLVYETVKRVQAPLYIAIQVTPSNFREGQTAKLCFRAINDLDPRNAELDWEIAGPDGGVVHRGSKQVAVASAISTLLESTIPPLRLSGTYKVRAHAAGYSNEHEFFYLSTKDFQVPAAQFAVLDPKGEITPFLKTRGLHFREFRGAGHLPVIVAGDTWRNPETFESVRQLMAYVKQGGVAVFLKTPGTRMIPKKVDNPLVRTGVFPFQTRLRNARGNWDPVNHGVRPHPIFEGLPTRDFMGQAYLNVCANETIEGIREPPIVGSLSYEWGTTRPDANYHGPRAVWWGSDLVAVPYGKGRLLLSTLRITENLGKDPVADKLFYNVVRWAAGGSAK